MAQQSLVFGSALLECHGMGGAGLHTHACSCLLCPPPPPLPAVDCSISTGLRALPGPRAAPAPLRPAAPAAAPAVAAPAAPAGEQLFASGAVLLCHPWVHLKVVDRCYCCCRWCRGDPLDWCWGAPCSCLPGCSPQHTGLLLTSAAGPPAAPPAAPLRLHVRRTAPARTERGAIHAAAGCRLLRDATRQPCPAALGTVSGVCFPNCIAKLLVDVRDSFDPPLLL